MALLVRLCALAACCALAGRPGLAFADDRVVEARRLFEEGAQLYRQQEFARARDLFERSFSLAARPRTLFNLAAAQDRLGEHAPAYENYRRFLVVAEPRDSTLVPRARARIAALGAMLRGRVEVRSTPSGAAVFVDNEPTSRGTTPAVLDIPLGPHEIRISSRGGAMQVRRIDVQPAGVVELDVALVTRSNAAPAPTAPSLFLSADDTRRIDDARARSFKTKLAIGSLFTGSGACLAAGVTFGWIAYAQGDDTEAMVADGLFLGALALAAGAAVVYVVTDPE